MSGGPNQVIGRGYAAGRRTDQRIAARIWAPLGNARTVVNIGAGIGSAFGSGERWQARLYLSGAKPQIMAPQPVSATERRAS